MLPYVLIAAGAFVVLIAGYEIRARLINRGVVRALVPHVLKMREMAHQIVGYRPPRADEPIAADARPLFDAAQSEISAAGLLLLGDLMEIHPNGTPFAPARWFIDESRTICGWFGVVRSRDTGVLNPVMMLFSESASGEFFMTARGASSTALAKPPANHRQFCDWGDGLMTIIGRHRAMLVSAAAMPVQQPTTLDAGPAIVRRLRDGTAQWRATQPADELIEQDVRSLLGKTFPVIGRQVIRSVTSLEVAT